MSLISGPIQNIDATVLFAGQTAANANVITGPPIDTNGSASVIWEVTGNAAFQMTIEGSNDQNFWVTLWSLPLSEVAQVDTINQNGIYAFDADTRYVRYNIAFASSNLTHFVYGRDSSPASAAGRLSAALDPTSNIALSTVITNLKKDASGALIPSDAAGPYNLFLQNASQSVVLDTTGYESVVIQQNTGGATSVTISNDGVNWISVYGMNLLTGGGIINALAVGLGIYSYPCAGRYIKFGGTATPASLVVYFRTTPAPSTVQQVGLATISGALPVSTGVNGVLAVAGGVAANSLASSNPIGIGGVDGTGLVKRLLVLNPALRTSFGGFSSNPNFSNAGVLPAGGIDQANNAQILPFISTSYQNIPPLAVEDVKQHEGDTLIQMISQMLLELRILNHQIHQLPLLLQQGIANAPDEPSALRNEQSLFTTDR